MTMMMIIIITNDKFRAVSMQSFKDRLQKLMSICKQGHDKQMQLQIRPLYDILNKWDFKCFLKTGSVLFLLR